MKKSSTALKRKLLDDAAGRPIDFAELPTYVGYQVRRTQAKIFSEFEAHLKEFDFTPGSFGVLTLIRANPGITQVMLAGAFGVDKSTMSPVIFRLEKRGLIRREILPSDRRCHALFLDEAGERIFLAAREKVRSFEENVAARLSKPEQRELARLLAKLQSGNGRAEGAADAG
jgi:DNA-binding MarR family transcriptional regulator